MDLSTFIVSVFCLTDGRPQGQRLYQRGPKPILADSEVLTMEVVGGRGGRHRGGPLYLLQTSLR